MITQEKQAVIVGELRSSQHESAAIIQYADGSIDMRPESEAMVIGRSAEYNDLAAFNSTIVKALTGTGEQLMDLTPEELCGLYNSTLNAITSLEASRYDHNT